MITHNFADSLAKGIEKEADLDSFFSTEFFIKPVSSERQRQGIDREFIKKGSSMCFTVEYKADSVAARTGNAFLELVSVDKDGRPGWAYTSQAQLLAYHIPPTGEVILVDMVQIKLMLPVWIQNCTRKIIPNKGKGGESYNTEGILVPLRLLRRYSIKSLNTK